MEAASNEGTKMALTRVEDIVEVQIDRRELAAELQAICNMVNTVAKSLGITLSASSERQEEKLNSAQAAALLGVHPSTLSRLAKGGYVPHERPGGNGGGTSGPYRFDASELLNIIQDGNLKDMVYWARVHPEIKPEVALNMVTLEEACENVGVNPRVIMRLAKTGKVSSALRGGKTVVNLSEVLDLFSDREET